MSTAVQLLYFSKVVASVLKVYIDKFNWLGIMYNILSIAEFLINPLNNLNYIQKYIQYIYNIYMYSKTEIFFLV